MITEHGKARVLIEPLLHKFYAASISIRTDGSMLVASTPDRTMAWTILFSVIATMSLVSWLVWRNKHQGKLALGIFTITVILSIVIIPSVRHEYIHVSAVALTINKGSWYRPSTTVLQMSNIKHIRESDETWIMPANLIGDPRVNWHLTWLDGETRVFRLNDFFIAHRMVVAYYYKDRGFWLERLEDQTARPL